MDMIDGKSSREGSKIYREQLITMEDLEVFKVDLLSEVKKLLKDVSGQPGKKWLKSSEVKKMLGISAGTLQSLRINGTLPYSKIGGIIFYNYEGITKLLDGNSNHP
jgi:hypothetical protein